MFYLAMLTLTAPCSHPIEELYGKSKKATWKHFHPSKAALFAVRYS